MAVKWPAGVTSSGLACGIKQGGALDLGFLVTEAPAVAAGTFTTNAAAASAVEWSRARIRKPVRAIVVNSGNANACTGTAGEVAVVETARAAAGVIGCEADEVLIASTGPIGVRLSARKIADALPAAHSSLSDDPDLFARSIVTTDKVTKVSSAGAGASRVVGVAKGAAMLAPNMATMLAFLVTDAEIPQADLQSALEGAVDASFNRISVDACESTNDSVFLIATGAAGPVDDDSLSRAITTVCLDLAEKMVRDAEGGSKFVRIGIEGATDEASAVELGKAVAASDLWRCAVNGSDPNWGRILSALGSVDRGLDIQKITIGIGGVTVFKEGEPIPSLDDAARAMRGDEVIVSVCVGRGAAAADVLTSDLSVEYVRLNASGT